MDRQRQFNESQVDILPQVLQEEIRQLRLAMKHASFYPEGHPIRAATAGETYRLLQNVLSRQENYSLTTVADKLYIDRSIADQSGMDADEQRYVASDPISTDIAREFRQRGIRSVIFSRGIQFWELEIFLNTVATRVKETRDQAGAAKLLTSAGDVPHIEIVDIEYRDTDFTPLVDGEDSMDAEDVLSSYLRGRTAELTKTASVYLSSLVEKPDLIAHLVGECAGYDGVREPDSAAVLQCMARLVDLGEQYTDEERKDFHRRLLEATLRMAHPLKNVFFSASDDSGMLTCLAGDLSSAEIARFGALECIIDGHAVSLRRMFDELLTSIQESAPGSAEEQFAEAEAMIRDELIKMGQEDVFSNTAVPLLEEIFTELEVDELRDEQLELESMLDRLHPTEQRQETHCSADEMMDIPAAEDHVISFASVLLEILGSETDYDDYTGVIDQLEETARFLIMEPQDKREIRDQYLSMAFRIIDTLYDRADVKHDKSSQWQERARKAMVNIATEEVIDQILSNLPETKRLEWDMLERLTQQMDERAIPPLVKSFLSAGNSFRRQKLRGILVSTGQIAVPELRRWLSRDQQAEVIEDIIPILSEIGGTEVFYCLSQALSHPDPQVRRAAVSALGEINNLTVANLISKKIRDSKEHESVKRLAISVLGEMGNEQAVKEIERIIREEDAVLQQEAIHALGNVGGAISISILSDILERRHSILGRRQTEKLQLHAVEALRQIGTQPAIKVLLEMSQRKRGKVKAACDEVLQSLDRAG